MKKFMQEEIDDNPRMKKGDQEFFRIMELPELSLAPARCGVDKSKNGLSLESEINLPMKRKLYSDHLLKSEPIIQTSDVDLQLKDPLPLDWEQCLDLQSGRMYYLNRKTLRKSWNWPKDQKLDLELNISCCSTNDQSSGSEKLQDSKKQHILSGGSSNMVALACLNCHLLVILSKSSPSCPNCKHIHSLPSAQQITTPPKVPTTVKSLNTLSLLN